MGPLICDRAQLTRAPRQEAKGKKNIPCCIMKKKKHNIIDTTHIGSFSCFNARVVDLVFDVLCCPLLPARGSNANSCRKARSFRNFFNYATSI